MFPSCLATVFTLVLNTTPIPSAYTTVRLYSGQNVVRRRPALMCTGLSALMLLSRVCKLPIPNLDPSWL